MNTIYRWGMQGGLGILDQIFFSGSNFLLNILLARWLYPEQYGAFALAFAIFLFFSGFHNALILEPMSILGPAKYPHELRSYVTDQLIIHIIVTGISALLIFITGSVLYIFRLTELFLSEYVLGVGMFLPLMLLMWLARRSCYVLGKPGWALLSSLLYSIVLISGAFLQRTQAYMAHPISWYLLLGIASLAGSLLIYGNRHITAFRKFDWISRLREQWLFGRWIILAAFLNFAGTQIQLLLVATQLGLYRAGAFRALQNFSLPMMQILAAVSMLALPRISLEFGRGNYRAMNVKALKVAVGAVSISTLYFVSLLLFARPAERLLYDGKFSESTALIGLIGLVPLITAGEIGFSLIVRSLQRPVYYAVSTGAMALAGVIFGPILVANWSIAGAVWSMILVSAISLALNMRFYFNWFVPELRSELSDP